MADRLINENDVLALIDAKLEATEALLGNAYAKAADRRVLASNISVLLQIKKQVRSVSEASLTDADMEAIGAMSCAA